MGFFDFNVPYESTPNTSTKITRIKLAVKAMELGYVGIAYNHTIRGVMSDKDHCSIPFLSLSNVLTHAPSLSSSVNFHRDILNIPRATPFRQYTRLTVCIESPGQSQALNSGNPILKTYDLIAVRPLNQIAFDHACEKAEVNIIAIDFARNLPFRLKQHMVKAAMERGIYFEITYSHLIADVQGRRQMISNAQLLVDWTGGKNLILTSAASSVTELRGPYDVANLSSLLGLSIERAKAAISKNCRNLITTALRKRHFYKEAVRVEQLPSDEKSNSNKPSYLDWLKWDPISSGEGDLQLDETTKSFAATPIASKTVKAVSIASVVDRIPSNVVNFLTTTTAIEIPVPTSESSEKSGGLDLRPEAVHTSLSNSPAKNQTESREPFANDNQTRIATSMADEETRTPMSAMEEETRTPTNLKNSDVSDMSADLVETERHGFQQQNGISSCEINVTLSNEDMIHQSATVNIQSDTSCAMDVEVDVLPENINLAPQVEKSLTLQDSHVVLDAENAALNGDVMEIDIKDQEDAPTTHYDSGEQPREPGDATVAVLDHIPLSVTPDMKIKDASSVTKHSKLKHVDIYSKSAVVLDGDLEVKEKCCSQSRPFSLDGATVKIDKREAETGTEMDHATLVSSLSDGGTEVGEKHEVEADTKTNHATLAPSLLGKVRARQWRPHQPLLFPFKRLLNPMPFKRSSKSKRKTDCKHQGPVF